MTTDNDRVLTALARVPDPEIPVVSVVDLGMIESVRAGEDGCLLVELLPTYVACPATNIILEDVRSALREEFGQREVRVTFSYAKPWTTDRIALGTAAKLTELEISLDGDCCFCHSKHTELISEFGPTPCRSAHFCLDCRNAFELFKTKVEAGRVEIQRR